MLDTCSIDTLDLIIQGIITMVRLVSLFKYYNYGEISIILQGIITMVRLVSLFKVLLFMKFYLVIILLCVGLTHQYTGYITHVPAFCVYAGIYLIKQNCSFHSVLRNTAFFKEYNNRMFFFCFVFFSSSDWQRENT